MSTCDETSQRPLPEERLALIEARLSRLERHLELTADLGDDPDGAAAAPTPEAAAASDEELEFALGQKWFARAGIMVLAIGAGFTLSLPYPGLPSALPSLVGYVLVGLLFLVSHRWEKSFDLVSHYFRAAAMALLFFATLRLFYFSATPALSLAAVPGKLLLVAAAGINLTIALRRQSPWLMALALAMGYSAAILVQSPGLLFPLLTALAVLAVYVWHRHRWTLILLGVMMATYLAHLHWALNNPLLGNPLRFAPEPFGSVLCILVYGMVFTLPALLNRDPEDKAYVVLAGSFLNLGLGYGLFLVHTTAAFEPAMVFSHLVAAGVFLGLAALLWRIRQSRIVCAFYATFGYMAMSMAILKAFPAPELFIWLSGQSLLVVATALWFRSPFIIVANFFIYCTIVLGYMVVTRHESGISIGFGLVALLSARILNWQQERLQLRTEMMRNAYLFVVFAVFPYALSHLLPKTLVALSWVAMAGVYYLMCWILKNQKYRWMGHFTLLLTVFYALSLSITQLKPEYRILSYLVLGTVLVFISLTFSRQKSRLK